MLEKSFFSESRKDHEELSNLIKERIETILKEGKIDYSEIQVGLGITSAQNGKVQGMAVIRVELYKQVLPTQGKYLFSVIPLTINFNDLKKTLSSPDLIKSFLLSAAALSPENEAIIPEQAIIDYLASLKQAINRVKNLK